MTQRRNQTVGTPVLESHSTAPTAVAGPGHKSMLAPDLANLDLLRTCAVLMVLMDHTFQAFAFRSVRMIWLGRLGVLFFFVHTSYVLLGSLQRQYAKGTSIWIPFYMRRVFRIYPLSVVAVLAVWGLLHLSYPVALSNLGLIQNVCGYPNAFPSIWSLPLEMEMYLFLPLLFLVASRPSGMWWILGLWALLCGAAEVQHHLTSALNLLTFSPCFVSGTLAWALARRRLLSLPPWSLPALLIVSILAFEIRPAWTGVSWAVCLLLACLLPCIRQSPWVTLNKFTWNLARYSYGIYLSHSVLLTFWHPRMATLLPFLLCVAVLSWAGFHLLEEPMIRVGGMVTSGSWYP